jgi:hypothetical protein
LLLPKPFRRQTGPKKPAKSGVASASAASQTKTGRNRILYVSLYVSPSPVLIFTMSQSWKKIQATLLAWARAEKKAVEEARASNASTMDKGRDLPSESSRERTNSALRN